MRKTTYGIRTNEHATNMGIYENMRKQNTAPPNQKANGEHTCNLKEEMQGCQNWIKINFQQNQEDAIPKITHIPEETWGKQTT